ncbi:MAG: alpha/beta hydrolase [Ruminococcus sp.]|nr:alpha/beta hydrolase [Ruminococcus sp.]
MKILEFGNKEKEKLLLIHGFQTPYQIWNEYIAHFKERYHIIVPVLPGHDPEQMEDFISFSECAKELEDWYMNRCGESVYAIYGMSMGGVLAACLWRNRRLKIQKLILESSPLLGTGRLMTEVQIKLYQMMTHKTQKRDPKIIRQAVSSIVPECLLEDFLKMMDHMPDETIEKYIRCLAAYRMPGDMDIPGTVLYYFHGTKSNEILAKKTARFLEQHYPDTHVICFQGKGHCEDSLLNPQVMLRKLEEVFTDA